MNQIVIELQDIEAGHYLTVDDYISALPKEVKPSIELLLRTTVRGLSSWSLRNLEYGQPEIYVCNVAEPNAEGITGLIRISHGLIWHCATVGIGDILNAFPMSEQFQLTILLQADFTRVLMLSWIAFHEIFHGHNRHSDAGRLLGNDFMTEQALEMDADLCAVTALYEITQPVFRKIGTDIEGRQLILVSIFWALRTLTSFCRRSTHSSFAVRFHNISGKLASLNERRGVPDVDFALMSTRHISQLLIETFIRCEKDFQAHPQYETAYGDAFKEWKSLYDNGELLAVASRWEEIRLSVAEIHGREVELEFERRLQKEL